jgi:hypothetical protein
MKPEKFDFHKYEDSFPPEGRLFTVIVCALLLLCALLVGAWFVVACIVTL